MRRRRFGARRGISQKAIVRDSDECFESHHPDEVRISQMLRQFPRDEVVTKRPSVTSEYEVCAHSLAGLDGVGETHHLERHLLLSGAARLLPLQRDDDRLASLTRDRVGLVCAAAAPRTHVDLTLV